jgi:hypothetical protein
MSHEIPGFRPLDSAHSARKFLFARFRVEQNQKLEQSFLKVIEAIASLP